MWLRGRKSKSGDHSHGTSDQAWHLQLGEVRPNDWTGEAPPPPPTRSDETEDQSRRKTRSNLRTFARVVAVGCAVLGLWLGGMLFYYTLKYPDPQAVGTAKQTPVLRILARDGTLLAERGGAHPYMPLALLPRHVIDAVVAIEDRRFFSHWGVDPGGLLRATLVNMRQGRFVQGGSTLTQQLAKNLFLTSERTMTRKLDELMLAIWLETRLTKADILELYLNRVYFGSGSYGIESASQRYFGKSARALKVAEAAILAGLLKAPSRLSPVSNPGLARQRGRLVLEKMFEAGLISQTVYASSQKQTVRFQKSKPRKTTSGAEYAVDFVLEQMPTLIDTGYGDVIVETTLDADLQQHARRTLSDLLAKNGKTLNAHQGALVVMDVQGGLRALVGGVDYRKSQFNRAVTAQRQPGSTFKPFVFLAALESGLRPTTLTYDLPITVEGWSPKNANGKFSGAVTLRDALARSINTVAVRLALDATPQRVAATANRLGITSDLKPEPSLALGTSEVSLLDLTSAYNVFGSGGQKTTFHVIRRIRSTGGRILYAHDEQPGGRLVADPHVAAMNDMLNAALVEGTGRRAGIPRHPAAGKTGTSQDFRDAWFIGYTAHMTAGVWLGNDRNRSMKKVSGGGLPARIWREVMTHAHQDLKPIPLPGTAWQGTRISGSPGPKPPPQASMGTQQLSANTRRPRARSGPAPQKQTRMFNPVPPTRAERRPQPVAKVNGPRPQKIATRVEPQRRLIIKPPPPPAPVPPLPSAKPNIWSLTLSRMLETGDLPSTQNRSGFSRISEDIKIGRANATAANNARQTPRSKPPGQMALGGAAGGLAPISRDEQTILTHEFIARGGTAVRGDVYPRQSIPDELFVQAQGIPVEPARGAQPPPALMYPAPQAQRATNRGFDAEDIRRRLLMGGPSN
ncbi:MAG: PBP1A family penicillin-binding protein [Pseudomonadota bacterium]